MDFSVVPLTIDEYDEVLALWQQSEGVALSGADSRMNVGAYLERNPGMSFVATRGRTLAGVVLGGHDGRRGYIHHLAVHPNFRRQGLGRRLVEHSLSALASAGIQKCHLFAINDNRDGIAFWKRIGWSPRADICVISKDLTKGEG